METGGDRNGFHPALIIGFSSLAALVGSGAVLLFFYCHAELVSPEIVGSERAGLVARRFLWNDGVTQALLVALTLWVAGTSSCAMVGALLLAAVPRSTANAVLNASAVAGFLAALSIVAYCVVIGAAA